MHRQMSPKVWSRHWMMTNVLNGWGGRTRTCSCLIQSQVPYQFGHTPAGRERLRDVRFQHQVSGASSERPSTAMYGSFLYLSL